MICANVVQPRKYAHAQLVVHADNGTAVGSESVMEESIQTVQGKSTVLQVVATEACCFTVSMHA